jgi:hypothetical protein
VRWLVPAAAAPGKFTLIKRADLEAGQRQQIRISRLLRQAKQPRHQLVHVGVFRTANTERGQQPQHRDKLGAVVYVGAQFLHAGVGCGHFWRRPPFHGRQRRA